MMWRKLSDEQFELEHPRGKRGEFVANEDLHEIHWHDEHGRHSHTTIRCKHCGFLLDKPAGSRRIECPTCGEDPERSLRSAKWTVAAMPNRKPGDQLYFEYHCHEGEDSSDAHLWYRSHSLVTVIGLGAPGLVGPGENSDTRADAGSPRVYRVRFEDGYEDDVFEDELVDSPTAYYRPDSPKPDDPSLYRRSKTAAAQVIPWGEQQQDYYRNAKTAMAERSGDPTLDKLIEAFLTHEIPWNDGETMLPIEAMRNSREAEGMCTEITTAFQAFVWHETNGALYPENAEMTDGSFHPESPSFEQMGYSDRKPGEPGHLVSVVEMPSGKYQVDWTAAQYGYKEFPMVQRLADEGWQREW